MDHRITSLLQYAQAYDDSVKNTLDQLLDIYQSDEFKPADLGYGRPVTSAPENIEDLVRTLSTNPTNLGRAANELARRTYKENSGIGVFDPGRYAELDKSTYYNATNQAVRQLVNRIREMQGQSQIEQAEADKLYLA